MGPTRIPSGSPEPRCPRKDSGGGPIPEKGFTLFGPGEQEGGLHKGPRLGDFPHFRWDKSNGVNQGRRRGELFPHNMGVYTLSWGGTKEGAPPLFINPGQKGCARKRENAVWPTQRKDPPGGKHGGPGVGPPTRGGTNMRGDHTGGGAHPQEGGEPLFLEQPQARE